MDIEELKPEFLKKYNRLFNEVATYYGVSKHVFFWRAKIAYIDLAYIGYKPPKSTKNPYEDEEKTSVYKFLSETYSYLEPFFHFFYNLRDLHTDDMVCKGNLADINIAVRAIRKEKREMDGFKEEYYHTYGVTDSNTSTNPCGEIPLQ